MFVSDQKEFFTKIVSIKMLILMLYIYIFFLITCNNRYDPWTYYTYERGCTS